jgi:hypothetical protein
MRISVVSTLLLATSAIAGRSPQHVNKKLPERMRREPAGLPAVGLDKRAATIPDEFLDPGFTYDDSGCGEAWAIMDHANEMQSMLSMAPRFPTSISILVSTMP